MFQFSSLFTTFFRETKICATFAVTFNQLQLISRGFILSACRNVTSHNKYQLFNTLSYKGLI